MSDMSLEEGCWLLLGVVDHSEESDSLGLERITIVCVFWISNFGSWVNGLPVVLVNKHVGHCLVVGKRSLYDNIAIGACTLVGSLVEFCGVLLH